MTQQIRTNNAKSNRNFNNQRPQKPENEVKERDMGQVVFYLQNMFRKVTEHLPRAKRDKNTGKPNEMYLLEREMGYLIHEMTMCAPCIQQIYITKVNEMIDDLLQQKRSKSAKKQR